MTKAQLEELLERVEKAEGPTFALFCEVFAALGFDNVEKPIPFYIKWPAQCSCWNDAAIALTEAVLPGWGRDHSNVSGPDGLWEVCMYSPDYNDSTGEHLGVGVHKSEPLALIAATLKALIAKETTQ